MFRQKERKSYSGKKNTEGTLFLKLLKLKQQQPQQNKNKTKKIT